jgi:hypothetical protein
MKKITLALDGQIDDKGAKEITTAINDLSGVVAADVIANESKAYAYAGDQLNAYTVSSKARDAGYNAHVLKEEYINSVDEYKKDMFPHAAPVTSILSD